MHGWLNSDRIARIFSVSRTCHSLFDLVWRHNWTVGARYSRNLLALQSYVSLIQPGFPYGFFGGVLFSERSGSRDSALVFLPQRKRKEKKNLPALGHINFGWRISVNCFYRQKLRKYSSESGEKIKLPPADCQHHSVLRERKMSQNEDEETNVVDSHLNNWAIYKSSSGTNYAFRKKNKCWKALHHLKWHERMTFTTLERRVVPV